MQIRKLYIVFLFFLSAYTLFFLLGCKSIPLVKLMGHSGTPVNEYDYLLAVFSYHDIAEQETNAVAKNTYEEKAIQCYRVWEKPQNYKFDSNVDHWTRRENADLDVYLNNERLKRFNLFLCVNKYPEYRDDMEKAVQELRAANKLLVTEYMFPTNRLKY